MKLEKLLYWGFSFFMPVGFLYLPKQKNMNPSPLVFSPMIIGTMRLGEWGVKMTTSELEAFIEECLALELKDFDHADIYGHYTTESDFGKVLKNRSDLRAKIRLTTKCGIKLITPNRPSHTIKSYDSTKAHIIASAEHSLKELSTDYLDLFLIHRPDFLMNPTEIAEAFESLRNSGKVNYFGVSNFTPSQFDLLNSYTPLTNNQIEASVLHLNPFQDGTLDQCLKHKIQPTAWSPLGGGAIFQKSENPQIIRIKRVAQIIADKHNVQLDQILFAWLLKHPASIIPVLGTSKINRIQAALEATKINLSHEEWYQLWEASTGHEVA